MAQLKPVVSESIFWVSLDLILRFVAMLCIGRIPLALQSKLFSDFWL